MSHIVHIDCVNGVNVLKTNPHEEMMCIHKNSFCEYSSLGPAFKSLGEFDQKV